MSLKIKTARNSMMMGTMLFIARPVNLGLAIVTARLLDPAEFGLVALALILVQSSNLFTNLGLDKAVIQSRDEIKQVAFQAFVMTTIGSAIFTVLIALNSTTLATWLGYAETAPVLRWLSLLVLIGGLSVVPASLLRKQLHFQYIALGNLCQLFIYAGVVIILAYTGWGVWSLVYSNLIASAAFMVLMWIWSPGWDWLKPQRWDFGIMKRLLRYGLQVCGSGFLSYFHTHWDDWLVGRMLGVTALGFYNKSYDFSHSVVGKFVTNMVGGVFMPSYTKIQEDRKRLARAYIKSLRLVSLLVTPLALGITIVADPLVQILFGDKWMPMVTVMQIFALLILTRPISENSAPLFQAVGRPGANIRAGFVLLLIMIPGVLLGIRWEIEGVAVAIAVSHLVGALYNIYQADQILPGTAKATLRLIGPIWVNGLVMAGGVYLVQPPIGRFFGTVYTLPALLATVSVGAVIYLLLSFLTQRTLINEILSTIWEALPKREAIGKRLQKSRNTVTPVRES